MLYSKQTMVDCGILTERSNASIYNFFNHTRTAGGALALQDMLNEKQDSIDGISEMQAAIKFAINHLPQLDLQLHNSDIYYIQEYFRLDFDSHSGEPFFNLIQRFNLSSDPTFSFLRSNIIRVASLMKAVERLIIVERDSLPVILEVIFDNCRRCLGEKEIRELVGKNLQNAGAAFFINVSIYLRSNFQKLFSDLLDSLFKLDAIVSIAITAVNQNLIFPSVGISPKLEIKGGYNLLIKAAVAYDIYLNEKTTLLFLTGANMAGKSTLLRSVSTIICLAHSGLPVPASEASMPFFDEVVIHINAADDTEKGYSKFYNEITLVKAVLDGINSGRKYFAVFDEIFSGTNLNDAMVCSQILFEKVHTPTYSVIMVSSHNIQLAGDNRADCIQYKYIETLVENGKPHFTYRLLPGINEIRLGALLFKNLK